MMIPVRCISCGKPVAHLWDKFQEAQKKGKDVGKMMDEAGLKRYCCRSTMLGQVDLIDEIARFRR